jgi:hypothetical protein
MNDPNLFMVYNDETGSFVDINEIQTVQAFTKASADGFKSVIILRNREDPLYSPLKPRELLRRISIIRYKYAQPRVGKPSAAAVPAQPEPAAEVAPSGVVSKRKK